MAPFKKGMGTPTPATPGMTPPLVGPDGKLIMQPSSALPTTDLQARIVNNPQPGGWFESRPPSVTNVPTLDLNQLGMQNQAIQNFPGVLQQLLQGLQAQSQRKYDFAPIAQKATTDFYSNVVPTLAERFGNVLGGESRGSSAAMGQIGAAGAGLKEGLAALEQQFGQQQQQYDLQNIGQYLGLLQLLMQGGLGRNFENLYDPGSMSGAQNMAVSMGQGIGQLGGIGLGLGLKALTGGVI